MRKILLSLTLLAAFSTLGLAGTTRAALTPVKHTAHHHHANHHAHRAAKHHAQHRRHQTV